MSEKPVKDNQESLFGPGSYETEGVSAGAQPLETADTDNKPTIREMIKAATRDSEKLRSNPNPERAAAMVAESVEHVNEQLEVFLENPVEIERLAKVEVPALDERGGGMYSTSVQQEITRDLIDRFNKTGYIGRVRREHIGKKISQTYSIKNEIEESTAAHKRAFQQKREEFIKYQSDLATVADEVHKMAEAIFTDGPAGYDSYEAENLLLDIESGAIHLDELSSSAAELYERYANEGELTVSEEELQGQTEEFRNQMADIFSQHKLAFIPTLTKLVNTQPGMAYSRFHVEKVFDQLVEQKDENTELKLLEFANRYYEKTIQLCGRRSAELSITPNSIVLRNLVNQALSRAFPKMTPLEKSKVIYGMFPNENARGTLASTEVQDRVEEVDRR